MLTTSNLMELQGPKVVIKLPLLGATIPPNVVIPLHGYGEMPSKHFACITTFTASVHFCMGTKLHTYYAKTKGATEIQIRCKQLLLAATTTPNFIVFCCTVPKKWHENVPHTVYREAALKNTQFL